MAVSSWMRNRGFSRWDLRFLGEGVDRLCGGWAICHNTDVLAPAHALAVEVITAVGYLQRQSKCVHEESAALHGVGSDHSDACDELDIMSGCVSMTEDQ